MRSLSLVAALTLTIVSFLKPSTRVGECTYSEWLQLPDPLEAGPGAKRSYAAALNGDDAVLAITYSTAPHRAGAEAALVLEMPGGAQLRAPYRDFSFSELRAAADTSGTIHLLWGERAPGPQSGMAFTDVWYARVEGGGWSEPERIYSADRIAWEQVRSSRLQMVANRLMVSFVSSRRSTSDVVVTLVRQRGQWLVLEHATSGLPVYADAMSGGDGRVVAYVTGHSSGAVMHENGLFLTFDSTRLMLAAADAYEPRIRASRRQASVAWLNRLSELRFARVSAEGVLLTVPPLALGSRLTDLQLVLDGCGIEHVVFVALQPPHSRLLYSRREGNRWTTPRQIGSSLAVAYPNLDLAGRKLHLTWTETLMTPPPTHAGDVRTRVRHATEMIRSSSQ